MPHAQPLPAPPTRKASPRYRARREAIIDVAARMIAKEGVGGMSLASVSTALGLAPTAVFYYFGSKEELAAACFLRAIDQLAAVRAVSAEGAPPAERVAAIAHGMVELQRRIALREAPPMASLGGVRPLGNPAVNDAFTALFLELREACFPEATGLPRTSRNARTHLLLQQFIWSNGWLRHHEPAYYAPAGRHLSNILLGGLVRDREAFRVRPLTAPPPPAEHGPSHEAFLRAAMRLINEQGYVGASVERISAALNVTKGAFYHLIENKDSLIKACFDRSIDVFHAALDEAAARGGPAAEVLASAAASLIARELSGAEPLLHTFALAAVPPEIARRVLIRLDRLGNRIAALVCEGIADGSIRPVDANIAAEAIVCLVNSASELTLFARKVTPETSTEEFVRPLFCGLYSN